MNYEFPFNSHAFLLDLKVDKFKAVFTVQLLSPSELNRLKSNRMLLLSEGQGLGKSNRSLRLHEAPADLIEDKASVAILDDLFKLKEGYLVPKGFELVFMLTNKKTNGTMAVVTCGAFDQINTVTYQC